jgi:hypothetical protein
MLTRVEGNAVQATELETSARTESKYPSTFTNGPDQPLRSFSWTVTSKYSSCNLLRLRTEATEFFFLNVKM